MKKEKLLLPLLYILAVGISMITIYPLLWVLCASVSQGSQMGRISIIPLGFTLERLKDLFTEYDFLLYFKNTFVYSIITVIGSLFINSMAAFSFARLSFPGKNLIFSVFLGTMMVPFTIIMVPLYLLVKNMGLDNSLTALILPGLSGAYGVFMLRQFYLGIPKDLEDAGKIDGLGYWGIYTRIIIPLSKPIMLTLAVFTFRGNWNNYLWPSIINTDKEYFLFSQGLAQFASYYNTDWNAVLAASAVSMLPIILIFIFFQRHLVEGIKLSGIKG